MVTARETFDRHLRDLMDQILVLGSMVEDAVLESLDSLKRRDVQNSRQIYARDSKVNEKRYAIESSVLTLIATQQPMARDLRLLAALLEINTELERMGDYAKGISKINILLENEPVDMPITDLEMMAERGLSMLRRALTAFVEYDAATARQIPREDDEVDAFYNKIYRGLMDQMIADPKCVDQVNHLMWAAHNLERMADRVTNICERIVFVTTGEMKELDVSDDEHYSAEG